MNSEVRAVLERSVEAALHEAVLEEGLVRYDRPGHTRQIALLPYCHEGRYSAGYYAFGLLTGQLPAEKGLEILQAVAELQIIDPVHRHYGGFRWYREEAEIQDSNAAFFILMPLVTVRLCVPDVFPAEHVELMDRMLGHAAVWFSHECAHPEIYYPNKIMSDGAMLLASAVLSGEERYAQEGLEFFRRWEDYTSRRGWGWGENLSLVYQSVMMNALRIAIQAIGFRDEELTRRLAGRMEELKEILRFHAGEEFVPTIRSYNFKGETVRKSLLWAAAGVRDFAEMSGYTCNLNDLVSLLLLEPEVAAGIRAQEEQPLPRVREERVFDDARAYSWIGGNVRLGSVSRFPVMPGSYQWPTWGLGWQSFPVSFSVQGKQVSYLRWYVDEGESIRTHPAFDYHGGYLKPALFKESIYPDVQTVSSQRENAALVLRSMNRVNHQVKELADEWVVHRFDGALESIATEAGSRLWHVLRYPHAAVAVTALLRLAEGDAERAQQPVAVGDKVRAQQPLAVEDEGRRQQLVAVVMDGDTLRLRQVLSSRAEAARLESWRLEAGWAVVAVDGEAGVEELEAYLNRYTIHDVTEPEAEVPRKVAGAMPRRCTLLLDGQPVVELYADPYHIFA
jgi:hypothetical protein